MTMIALHRGTAESADLDRIDYHIPLGVVLQLALERILGRPLKDMDLMLRLSPDPADPHLAGNPTLYNLVPDYGFAIVEVVDRGIILYRHPHTVREVVATPLQELLRQLFPDVAAWSYRIGFKQSELYITRPTPEVAGGFTLPSSPATRFSFSLRQIEDPEPPEARLSDFKAPGTDADVPAVVLVERRVFDDFDSRNLSQHVEEGGFLLGSVHRDGDHDHRYIVRISDAPSAHNTGASLLCFTFTGDSFRAMKESIADRQLLGWWHTHLFSATERFGLSTIDVDLHLRTFRKDWQIAGLINIDPITRRRTLRFYARRSEMLVECPRWVIEQVVPSEMRS